MAAPCSTNLEILPRSNGFGAQIEGLDLSEPLSTEHVAAIRQAWLTHKVVFFPNQPLSHSQLEQFALQFGQFGVDPFVKPVTGHKHVLEVRREPDETVIPFGASWHSDWSFQKAPPSATILHGKIIPPCGGETQFADGVRAYDKLDKTLKNELTGLRAIHSARRPYSHEGYQRSGGRKRSMTIEPSDAAWDSQTHPIFRTHPETGEIALWVNPVYTIGIEGLSDIEAKDVLRRITQHQLKEEFIYTHKWSENMLTMWDNRCVHHAALGGYDGHLRVMHRVTLAGDIPT